MPEGFLRNLPDGPACARCGSRTFVATINPHPTKPVKTRYSFECPRCFHLQTMSVSRRGSQVRNFEAVQHHIAHAESRIARQERLIRRLGSQGRDSAREESLLEILRQSL